MIDLGYKTASTRNKEMVSKRAVKKWDDLDVYLPSVKIIFVE